MSDWIIWMALAGSMLVLEMFTGTFYLLMIGIGLTAGGLAALSGMGVPIQFLLASLVGVVTTYMLRRSRHGRSSHIAATRDPNVNLDIGQVLLVDKWNSAESGVHTARAMYRGAMWDIELQEGSVAQSGMFVIREIKGSRLIVANARSHGH
jgi:membrane protein implicated in regulation of membrane protease activity